MKNVTSKDPRKHAIVAALKSKSGGSKVTLVKETSTGAFQGHCQKLEIIPKFGFMVKTGAWESLGTFEVTAEECGLENK
jgi:hypothetical protein